MISLGRRLAASSHSKRAAYSLTYQLAFAVCPRDRCTVPSTTFIQVPTCTARLHIWIIPYPSNTYPSAPHSWRWIPSRSASGPSIAAAQGVQRGQVRWASASCHSENVTRTCAHCLSMRPLFTVTPYESPSVVLSPTSALGDD